MTPPRLAVRSALLLGALLAGAPCVQACDRAYSVGVSESGTFVFSENGQLKGLVPTLLEELTRRTGCRFIIENMPRARLWLQWQAGALDIASGAVQTPERDQLGAWVGFGYVREELFTRLAPPGSTLEGWLNLPERPTLGHLRSAVSGGPADQLLARPGYAAQIEEAVDHVTLIRKLFAQRNTGILLPRPSFDNLARQNGFDPTAMTSYRVDELPRVAYGFYFRAPQVTAKDQQLLASTLNGLLKSGFNESAYAAIVGKAVAAQLFHDH